MEFELWVRIVKESIHRGNMDPWDINVAKVAEEYIKTLRELERFDIRLSADVILVGGILLRMKSQYLYERCVSTSQEDSSLKESRHSKRRRGRKKVTTEKLIDDIKLEVKKVKKVRRKREHIGEEILYEIIEELEKYHISELIETLISELREEGVIVFQEKFSDRESKVKNFLPCLYLASEGKVEIFQKEVFKEMIVKYRDR
ncbi:MAG TPA: segregation/condensation protein A [Methanothermococcus okinawensis]|uniref:Segregation/condensation protein A n=1 Tax=Methanothermococcus okinawensis TaxID=155863 RepID=A0A832ZAT0_9EURY|nr:segregation/condensation protein A [Methanococcaceae archaeon]HIP84509.1 segregation/condensation protein A [Methanothermococcus okinawensis]HIP91082.1 segregation/condensation protein A [Methanothermococcus okinawensis]